MLITDRVLEVRHNTSLTLHCPMATPGYTVRHWYTWANQPHHFTIYSQTAAGVTKGTRARDGISLDMDNFDLTIGRVTQLDDNFICYVTTPQGTRFDIILLAIYRECYLHLIHAIDHLVFLG